MDRRRRESEGKAKIEGYMSVSDEEAYHRRQDSFTTLMCFDLVMDKQSPFGAPNAQMRQR